MLTERDRKIIGHIREFDGITIKQCELIFFKGVSYGYDVARKRLNRMVKDGLIKVTKNSSTNENVYYSEKKLTYSEIVVMNFYAEMISVGIPVQQFTRNISLLDDKFTADAFCTYLVGTKVYMLFVEACLSYNKLNFHKYVKLYESQIFQNEFSAFPKVIVIDSFEHKAPPSLPNIDIITVNLTFDNLAKIFVENN